MIQTLQSWFGLAGSSPAPAADPAPLRELVTALDRLEPARAQYLARFAYLLGRVAGADDNISEQETRAMEAVLSDHGGLSPEQAMLVVSLAKVSTLMFGATTADFAVTQEFTDTTGYDDKVALARCLFAVAASDERISITEEAEIHRIIGQLRIEPKDLLAMRLQHRRFLPGLSDSTTAPQ